MLPGAAPATPLRYQCQRCGNCCRWPGFVRLTAADITALAGHFKLGEREFISRHTRLRPARDGLALLDKPNGECAMLDDFNRCSVQAAKPEQCRGFPNAWNFPGWREVCEAVEIDLDQTTPQAGEPGAFPRPGEAAPR